VSEKPEGAVPWPKTEDELLAYVRQMIAWPDGASEPGEGYGRCVYSMAYAAAAAFNYVAHVLGTTGFQASAAQLEFLSESRGMKHGFMIADANKLLYPQYDLEGDVLKWIGETRPRLATAARELLTKANGAHPEVLAHWERIAALEATP